MKKVTVILILTAGFVLNLFAQNYIAKYQSFASKDCDSAILIFNATEWVYVEYHIPAATKINTVMNGTEVTADELDNFDIPAEIKNHKSPQYTLFSYHSLYENEYLKQESGGFVIKSPMRRLEWTISPDSTKTFGVYQCLMAAADLCGVPVQVWFAPEIPVPCGPDRFWGLPGLIVSVKSDDGKVFLELLSLCKSENAPIKPQISNTLTKEQYWEAYKEQTEKIKREIMAIISNEHGSASVSILPTTDRDKCLLE
jgi:GLPGLI family protein